MIDLKEVHIPDKLYLTKKLEPKTVQKVLGSSVITVDRLFCIVNSAPTLLDLIDQKIAGHLVKMYVKLEWAYAGDARRQVSNLRTWRQLVRRKPAWILRVVIEDNNHHTAYTFEHRYARINHLYDGIEDELQHLHHLVETKLSKIL